MISLRPYQLAAIEALRASIRGGHRRPLLVAPTGSGKGVALAYLLANAARLGNRSLFLVHRREILHQISEKLHAYECPHGIIAGHAGNPDPSAPVQLASVQTLARRDAPPAELVVVDEAHLARAATYERVLSRYTCPVVGLTATPVRLDGRGLGELFDDLLVMAQPREMIVQGYLCDYDGYSFETPDLRGVPTARGDYQPGALELAVSQPMIVGGIVERWRAYANGSPTVAFACTLAHATSLQERFGAAGVRARVVSGSSKDRVQILESFTRREFPVLINCQLLVEGWDCPQVECVILARPTKSLTVYLQSVGRGFRPAPGKQRLRIHDHGGNMLRHGLPDESRAWALTADRARRHGAQVASVRQCLSCYRIYPADLAACPGCTEPAPHRERQVREGTGRALTIDEVRKRRATMDEKRVTYHSLLAEAVKRGYKRGWAAHQYRSRYGVWPKGVK